MNLCIIQARSNSTRLPGKVLLNVAGKTLLEHLFKRIKLSNKIDKFVLATTTDESDNPIAHLCSRLGIDCYRGSIDDVLDRFYSCSLHYPEFENIIRITGDCPLIDPKVIDQVVNLFLQEKADYASNVNPPTYPDGLDVEVFKKSALAEAVQNAKLNSEREHVTLYIRKNNSYKKSNLEAPKDYSSFRLTVDNPEDFEVIKFLIENSRPTDSYLDLINLLLANPGVMKKNIHIGRNEGLKKSLENDTTIE